MGDVINLSPLKGQTLLARARDAGVALETPCGGMGLCGKCKVRIRSGSVSPVTDQEKLSLSPRELADGVRLACRAVPLEPVELELQGPFFKQATEAEGIALTASPKSGRPLGVAVDLGTTTVAVALWDLETGVRLEEESFLNPQAVYGSDVLSRIHYDMEHDDGALQLQRTIVAALQASILRLAGPSAPVREIVVAGNTVMLHAFLGARLAGLGRAPYQGVFAGPVSTEAGRLGFQICSGAEVYCLPSASAYIGGDIIAGAAAAHLDTAADTVLYLDIGTNGEILLSRHGKLYACSCAAGPALEGMGISCGMRAQPGAVDRVAWENGQISLGVIGGVPPRGLCGSGVLEAVSLAAAHGAVGANGRIAKASPLAETDETGRRRIVLDREHAIFLTQGDIRQVQLCKGALCAGIRTLLDKLGTEIEDVDRALIAGQFGAHLSQDSLIGVGILPEVLRGRIQYLGNACAAGAALCLLSPSERPRAEKIAGEMRCVDLSTSPRFSDIFVRSLTLGDF